MARVGMRDIDNYGNNLTNSFFQLKNDKDIAQVRFMYNDFDDIPVYVVHEVEVNGKTRYVNCLREYNEPIDNCPLCAAKYRVIVKMFLQLYDLDSQEIKVWDRGKSFKSTLESLCARYKPLVATPFEIERNGKPGETTTSYMPYALATDDTTLEDLPELPEILGGIILEKDYDEIMDFLETGFFPENTVEEPAPRARTPEAAPQRRQAAAPANAGPTRRTPATAAPAQRATTAPASGRRQGPQDKF